MDNGSAAEAMSEAQIQREQRERYLAFVKNEGGIEVAVRDSTYLEPCQIERTAWLVKNTADVPPFLFSQYKSILELGCSGGHQLVACQGYVGLDINPDTIRANRPKYPKQLWFVYNVTKPGWYDLLPSFHTVMVPDIIEHLAFDDALQLIRDCKKLAKHRILITTPNGTDLAKNQRNWTVKKHQWVCTIPKLKTLLDTCRGTGWILTHQEDEAFEYVRLDHK